MNKKELKNKGYEVYKEDSEYFYAIDKANYRYNFNKRVNKICLKNICKENIFSLNNIKEYIKNNNIPVELISNSFEDVSKKLLFKDINGHIFERSWKNITRSCSTFLCPECSIKYRAKKRKISNEQVKDEFLTRGLILLEDYENNRIPMLCEDINGYKGKISRQNFSMGKTFDRFSTLNEYTIYNIERYIKINKIPLILISKSYNGYNEPLIWKCECGNIFKRTLEELGHRKVYRCPICTNRVSGNEFKIQQFLNLYNIEYIKEYKFKDCKYKKELPFDFYLPKYNLCIEAQGEQHYKPVLFGGRSKKDSIKEFYFQREKDKIKENYCKEHKISLLKIPYLDLNSDNYKKIISYKLNINT